MLCARHRMNSVRLRYPDKMLPERNAPGKNPLEKVPSNAVECEPVRTRVLNHNASEASYKPKQS